MGKRIDAVRKKIAGLIGPKPTIPAAVLLPPPPIVAHVERPDRVSRNGHRPGDGDRHDDPDFQAKVADRTAWFKARHDAARAARDKPKE